MLCMLISAAARHMHRGTDVPQLAMAMAYQLKLPITPRNPSSLGLVWEDVRHSTCK